MSEKLKGTTTTTTTTTKKKREKNPERGIGDDDNEPSMYVLGRGESGGEHGYDTWGLK